MAIPIPVTRSKIATATWGIPITEEVNRLTLATAVTPWTGVTFQNGWVQSSGDQACQYRKVGDVVQLRGRMTSGTMNVAAFTLPAGFRPPAAFLLPVTAVNGGVWTTAVAYVQPDGTFVPTVPVGNTNFAIFCQFYL